MELYSSFSFRDSFFSDFCVLRQQHFYSRAKIFRELDRKPQNSVRQLNHKHTAGCCAMHKDREYHEMAARDTRGQHLPTQCS